MGWIRLVRSFIVRFGSVRVGSGGYKLTHVQDSRASYSEAGASRVTRTVLLFLLVPFIICQRPNATWRKCWYGTRARPWAPRRWGWHLDVDDRRRSFSADAPSTRRQLKLHSNRVYIYQLPPHRANYQWVVASKLTAGYVLSLAHRYVCHGQGTLSLLDFCDAQPRGEWTEWGLTFHACIGTDNQSSTDKRQNAKKAD